MRAFSGDASAQPGDVWGAALTRGGPGDGGDRVEFVDERNHATAFLPLTLSGCVRLFEVRYGRWDARCSASHWVLIHPRLGRLATRASWISAAMIARAATVSNTVAVSNMVVMRQALRRVTASIVADQAAVVCAVMHICTRFGDVPRSRV
jgi:hypothetical protein